MSAGPLLRYASAAVGYGGASVLREVSLDVERGELVGLVGPNGAGKSTLLRTVTGDARLLDGSVELAGRPLADFTARERARVVGVVPQQVLAAFSIPAAEFVGMGRHPHLARFTAPTDADRDAVERAMAVTDTLHLAAKPVDALSGGDLQRLAFAQALAQEPQLLLLDEATSHLDLNHRLQVLDLVRDLVSEGIGALAVFHDLDLAARYADRIAVVADGSVSDGRCPAEAIDARMLRSVFGVRAVVGTDPVTGAVTVTPILREGAVAREARGLAFVVGGSGVAAPLMRRLYLSGWQVASGALNAGDADATLADALGIPYVHLAPFAPMDADALGEATALAASADVIVVCDVPFGHGNVGNLKAAVRAGRPLVLVGDIEGRDFTGGTAEAVWHEAVAAGALRAVRAADVDGLLVALADSAAGGL